MQSTKTDAKPCRVCTDFKTWAKTEKRQAESSTRSAWGDYEAETPCPPDSVELGRHTWTLLHTVAAYYPTHPTEADQTNMSLFLSSFSKLYPCGYCATHLRQEMAAYPPPVDTRDHLNRWLCRVHNDVNERLGKPAFDCNRIMERWKESLNVARCG